MAVAAQTILMDTAARVLQCSLETTAKLVGHITVVIQISTNITPSYSAHNFRHFERRVYVLAILSTSEFA